MQHICLEFTLRSSPPIFFKKHTIDKKRKIINHIFIVHISIYIIYYFIEHHFHAIVMGCSTKRSASLGSHGPDPEFSSCFLSKTGVIPVFKRSIKVPGVVMRKYKAYMTTQIIEEQEISNPITSAHLGYSYSSNVTGL